MPQNWPPPQALPQAPQLLLSTIKLLQRSEQQIISLPQPVLVPSCWALHAAVHSPPLQTYSGVHSLSLMQCLQLWSLPHTPLAQLVVSSLQPGAHSLSAVQYFPLGH